MLSDDRRRAWVLKQVRDEDVLRFWTREFPGYTRQLQAEAVAAPLNKLGALMGNAPVRAMLTKPRPVLDGDACMAKRRIVLARLSKGAIGEDGALLLGGLLLGLFQRATLAREALPTEARTHFVILVDEAGSFATRPFLELLAESRKYGCSVYLATQGLAILEPEVRAGMLANVGTLVAFRVGAEDALLLQKEFAERFGPPTLMQLDVGERVVKVGGKDAQIVQP